MGQTTNDVEHLGDQHHRIYQAICDHDPVAAQEAMVLHLQDVKDLIARATSHRGRPKA
jgi:DNA-binding FadR family transcriptional regulator